MRLGLGLRGVRWFGARFRVAPHLERLADALLRHHDVHGVRGLRMRRGLAARVQRRVLSRKWTAPPCPALRLTWEVHCACLSLPPSHLEAHVYGACLPPLHLPLPPSHLAVHGARQGRRRAGAGVKVGRGLVLLHHGGRGLLQRRRHCTRIPGRDRQKRYCEQGQRCAETHSAAATAPTRRRQRARGESSTSSASAASVPNRHECSRHGRRTNEGRGTRGRSSPRGRTPPALHT